MDLGSRSEYGPIENKIFDSKVENESLERGFTVTTRILSENYVM